MKIGFTSGDWVHPEGTHDEVERWGGSGWARLGQYRDLLPFEIVTGILVWNKTHFEVSTPDGARHDVDMIYMQRLMHGGIADNIIRARKYGQVIINDLDDWYWGLSTSNNAFRVNHPKNNPIENINFYKTTVARSDVITVSTPYLADRVKHYVKGEIVLMPNTVDLQRFTAKEHVDVEVPTVGWVGSTAHRSGDLETLRGIVGPLATRGHIRLYHGGHHEGAPMFADALAVSEDLVDTRPLVDHFDYPSLMSMDIGIVPLRDTPFNLSKSYIKGLEYAAAGVPFIAQHVGEYVRLAQDIGVGRTSKKATDWLRHIRELSNVSVRAEESARNRELIEGCDIRHGVSRLTALFNSL